MFTSLLCPHTDDTECTGQSDCVTQGHCQTHKQVADQDSGLHRLFPTDCQAHFDWIPVKPTPSPQHSSMAFLYSLVLCYVYRRSSDELEVQYALFAYDFNESKGDYISEVFVVRQNPIDPMQAKKPCVFTVRSSHHRNSRCVKEAPMIMWRLDGWCLQDLSSEDALRHVYLVCTVVRVGPMTDAIPTKCRRPLAGAGIRT